MQIQAKDHIGLIYKVARDLQAQNPMCQRQLGTDMDNYLAIGFIALQKAINRYNPEKDSWPNYPCRIIHRAIIDAAHEESLIKIGRTTSIKASRLKEGSDASDGMKQVLRWRNTKLVSADILSQLSIEPETPEFETKESIDYAMRPLQHRERQIIRRRFGLHGFDQMTLEDIGVELNICRERVRQIEASALRKMRRRLAHQQ